MNGNTRPRTFDGILRRLSGAKQHSSNVSVDCRVPGHQTPAVLTGGVRHSVTVVHAVAEEVPA